MREIVSIRNEMAPAAMESDFLAISIYAKKAPDRSLCILTVTVVRVRKLIALMSSAILKLRMKYQGSTRM